MNCSCLKYILKPFICAGPSPTTKLNGFHLTYSEDAIFIACGICKFNFFYFFVVKEHDLSHLAKDVKGYTLFFFFYKNVVFLAQAEYSYFSADFRLKIFLYYS